MRSLASWASHAACALLCFSTRASAAPTENPSAASYYIPSLPHIHEDPDLPLQMYGGHISADPNITRAADTDVTPHLYFFMVKSRRMADKQRIVFWFNGGPGCSSFDGAMMEVGPWRWDGKSEHDFWVKAGGWEEYTTMVYVDQPPGTGFSYTRTDRYVHHIDAAQEYLLEFFKNFYRVFPEYKTVDTYFAGESFAGQYIPYFADAVLKSSSLKMPLKGIAIGNGWIDSRAQYEGYLEFATKTGLVQENAENWKKVKDALDTCTAAMDKLGKNPMSVPECGHVIRAVMEAKEYEKDGQDMCINIYDIRLDDEAPACGMNWPPEMPAITKFLDLPEVVAALHATAHPGSWTECKGAVHKSFQQYSSESAVSVLPYVLSKIPVLIFAGDQDLICNYVGLENMIKTLSWNGGTGLGTVQTQSYSVDSQPAGTWVSSRNLTYVKLFNASHMAPFDIPHVTHDMMLRFMGVNFTGLVGGTAKIPSAIGTSNVKPVFIEEQEGGKKIGASAGAKTAQQDKAMWEAYYNAGSAALVLVLVLVIIGTFVWCRLRRRRVQLPTSLPRGAEEESIPLTSTRDGEGDDEAMRRRSAKGKERAKGRQGEEAVALNGGRGAVQEEERIFDVGDSDDEEYKHSK